MPVPVTRSFKLRACEKRVATRPPTQLVDYHPSCTRADTLPALHMIIPINTPSATANNTSKFPPQLAKLGTEEIILIELQGSFQVEGDKSGQLAATLRFDGNEVNLLMSLQHHRWLIMRYSELKAYNDHRTPPSRRQNRQSFQTTCSTGEEGSCKQP